MINSEETGRVYKLMGVGLSMFIGGLWLNTFGMLTGTIYLTLSIAGIGLLMFFYGLVIGLRLAYSDDGKKPVTMHADVNIVARIMETKDREIVIDPEMYPEDQLVRFVQVRFPDGVVRELKAEPEVFEFANEGMDGTVHIQGNSLLAFKWDQREENNEMSEQVANPFYRDKLKKQ